MKVVEKLYIREEVNFEKRIKYMMYEMLPNFFQIVTIICIFGDFFLLYNDILIVHFFSYMHFMVHSSLNNIFYKHD